MAEIFTDEGLDKILGIVPKNGTNVSSLYIGLFTSQTASTVPARTAVGGAAPSGWTEATGTSYARQAIAAGLVGLLRNPGRGRGSLCRLGFWRKRIHPRRQPGLHPDGRGHLCGFIQRRGSSRSGDGWRRSGGCGWRWHSLA